MSRRRRAATAVAVVVLAGAAWAAVGHGDETDCGGSVRSYDAAGSEDPLAVGDAPSPLVDALAATGEVLGSRGYDHGEAVQLSAYAEGLGVRLRDSNRFVLLEGGQAGLEPRWSVAVGTPRSTFDADAETYVVTTLPDGEPPELVALDLATGERRWCHPVDADPAPAGVSTQLLGDGSVVALLTYDSDQRLLRLGSDGERWSEALSAGEGDFLGLLDDDTALVGGSPLEDLLDRATLEARPAGDRLRTVDLGTGRDGWSWSAPAGTDVRVIGTGDSRVLLTRAVAGAEQPELVALDVEGDEAWAVVPSPGTAFDASLRGGRVVVRAGSAWAAYDAGDGTRLWHFEVPDGPQLLPYGATLDAMPSLDADTMLVGGTRALIELDLATGERTGVPLPTDGLATTYWPYQVVAAPGLLAVATNTGAVVVRR